MNIDIFSTIPMELFLILLSNEILILNFLIFENKIISNKIPIVISVIIDVIDWLLVIIAKTTTNTKLTILNNTLIKLAILFSFS